MVTVWLWRGGPRGAWHWLDEENALETGGGFGSGVPCSYEDKRHALATLAQCMQGTAYTIEEHSPPAEYLHADSREDCLDA